MTNTIERTTFDFENLKMILSHDTPSTYFHEMYNNGILIKILPDIHHMNVIDGDGILHKYNAFEHTMRVIDTVNTDIIANMIDNNEQIYDILRLAALFHDVGKPITFSIIDKRTRFIDHDKVGASITKSVLHELGASKNERRMVSELVRRHMMFTNKEIDKLKAIKKVFSTFERRYGEIAYLLTKSLIALCYADVYGCDGTIWNDANELLLHLSR